MINTMLGNVIYDILKKIIIVDVLLEIIVVQYI
jgi:hypothetical protein